MQEEEREEDATKQQASSSIIDWANAIPVLLPGEPGAYEEDLCLNALGEARIDVRVGRAMKELIWNRWSRVPQFRAVSSWDIIMRSPCLPARIPIHSRFVSFYGEDGCTPQRGVCDAHLYLADNNDDEDGALLSW